MPVSKVKLPFYKVNTARTLLLSAIAFAADLLAIPLILRSKKIISIQELEALPSIIIRRLDRIALHQDIQQREILQKQSDDLLRGTIALNILLLANGRIRAQALEVFSLYAAAHAATYTIYSFSPLGPAFRDKYRPIVYYQALTGTVRTPGNNRNSGYSGHTGNAACATMFMANVLIANSPSLGRTAKLVIYGLALIPPILVGRLRVKALKHFPSDVALAILIGTICGIAVPSMFQVSPAKR